MKYNRFQYSADNPIRLPKYVAINIKKFSTNMRLLVAIISFSFSFTVSNQALAEQTVSTAKTLSDRIEIVVGIIKQRPFAIDDALNPGMHVEICNLILQKFISKNVRYSYSVSILPPPRLMAGMRGDKVDLAIIFKDNKSMSDSVTPIANVHAVELAMYAPSAYLFKETVGLYEKDNYEQSITKSYFVGTVINRNVGDIFSTGNIIKSEKNPITSSLRCF